MSPQSDEWRYIEISESFKASVKVESEETIFIGGAHQIVGKLHVRLYYSCDKLLGKCFENGKLIPTLTAGSDVDLKLYAYVNNATGKLDCEKIDYYTVVLNVKRGSGEGYVDLEYHIHAKTLKIDMHTISINLTYSTEKGTKIEIYDVSFSFNAIKPIVIRDLRIDPKDKYYALKDPVTLSLDIAASYRGTMYVMCRGALREEVHEFKIDSESKVLSIKTLIDKLINRVEVTVTIPSIEYEESIAREITVKNRVMVNNIRVDNTAVGKEALLTISITNASRISSTRVHIDANIYGYDLSITEDLKPDETKDIKRRTPIVTSKAASKLKGRIAILDEVSGQRESISLDLPKPTPLQLQVDVPAKELRIPSSTPQELALNIRNDGDVDVEVKPVSTSLTKCKISSSDTAVKIAQYTQGSFKLLLKPIALGSEIIRIDLAVLVNGVVVDERSVNISIEVYSSFKIMEYTIINPSKIQQAVKGQKIGVSIKVKLFYERVELLVSSEDLDIESSRYVVHQPEAAIDIVGRAVKYGDRIAIKVSDGLVSELVEIPIKVLKPSVEYELQLQKLYAGLRRSSTLSLKNRFEVFLKVVIEFSSAEFVKFSDRSKMEIEIPPLTEKKEWVYIVGLGAGKYDMKITLTSSYIDEETGKVMDEWSHSSTLILEFHEPISIVVTRPSGRILLPHRLHGEYSELELFFKASLSVKNVTDFIIPEVLIELHSDKITIEKISPKTIAIEPEGEVSIDVELSIPLNYPDNSIKLDLNARIDQYTLSKTFIKEVERYDYYIVEVLKEIFEKSRCEYPGVVRGGVVYVFIPLSASDCRVCGEVERLSIARYETFKLLYNTLKKILPSYQTPWDTVATILLKRILYMYEDSGRKDDILKSLEFIDGDIVMIPALIWSLCIANLVGDTNLAKSLYEKINIKLITEKKLGLLYIKNGPFYIAGSSIYGDLLKFVLDRDDEASKRVYEYILASIKNMNFEPIFLTYTLSNGRRIPYDVRLAERLYNEKRLDSYVLYLAISNAPVKDEPDILDKLQNIASRLVETGKKYTVLSLALLLHRIFYETLEEVVKMVKEIEKVEGS